MAALGMGAGARLVRWVAMLLCGCGLVRGDELTVSAAASLKPALEELRTEFEKSGVRVVFNFGASGALQQQIVNGAPVDVFLSAAVRPMDDLERAGLLVEGTRRVVAGNTIVVIAPRDRVEPRTIEGLASVGMVAIGEPASVPAGAYAMEVFRYFGLVEALKGRLVFGKDVRQVLVYVETGEVGAGVVYASDVKGVGGIRVVGTAPPDSHRPVEYPGGVVKGSPHSREAEKFLEFLTSDLARGVFQRRGFVVPSKP